MPETREQQEQRHLREFEGKNVQHYAVLLANWLHTRMEYDRALLTLSAAAIGLLVTILSTVGVPKLWMLWLYIGALAGFLTTIWTTLRIYRLNADKLEQELRDAEASGHKQINLVPYDRLSVWAFVAGAAFSIVIGGATAKLSFDTDTKEEPMADEKKIQPSPSEKRSFQGIENLKPQLQQFVHPESAPVGPVVQPTPVAPQPAPESTPSEGGDS